LRPLETLQLGVIEACRLTAPVREAALSRIWWSYGWLARLLGLPDEAPPAQNNARYTRLNEDESGAALRLMLVLPCVAEDPPTETTIRVRARPEG